MAEYVFLICLQSCLKTSMRSVFYERLFQLNRCLEQACEILDLYELDGIIHSVYANARKRSLEDLRTDMSHILTGMLHQRELEACVAAVRTNPEPEQMGDDHSKL